jgi:hypothetical protein
MENVFWLVYCVGICLTMGVAGYINRHGQTTNTLMLITWVTGFSLLWPLSWSVVVLVAAWRASKSLR